MILLLTFLYCCGYINTMMLYFSIDKKYRTNGLDNWWPVLAVLFWWVVAIWCFYLILFKTGGKLE